MKSYADIKQCAQLLLFLPIESADMKFPYLGDGQYGTTPLFGEPIEFSGGKDIPCWSLAALLEVLPERVYVPYLQKEDGKYHAAYGNYELLCEADNPVDACYEMILKLYKQKLL